eukprot:5458300-Pleurochrysis_carterae.AAC.4
MSLWNLSRTFCGVGWLLERRDPLCAPCLAPGHAYAQSRPPPQTTHPCHQPPLTLLDRLPCAAQCAR